MWLVPPQQYHPVIQAQFFIGQGDSQKGAKKGKAKPEVEASPDAIHGQTQQAQKQVCDAVCLVLFVSEAAQSETALALAWHFDGKPASVCPVCTLA
jgi:hypothetical protein